MKRENVVIDQAVSYFSQEWQLSDLRPLAEGRLVNNYLVTAYSAVYNADVVLKILLWEDAQKYEAAALRYFDGSGCVKPLAYNEQYHALLLPYIKPGETLRTMFPVGDDRATRILVEICKKLHGRPISGSDAAHFPTVMQWLAALDGTYNKIPKSLLEDARSRVKRLVQRMSVMYLLHGDLHHENILHDNDGWIAIDPKGVIGEREYEFGAFIRNPYPDLLAQRGVASIIHKRIALCSELSGFDPDRITDWAFVQAVMSACWTHKVGKEDLMNYFVACASTIQH